MSTVADWPPQFFQTEISSWVAFRSTMAMNGHPQACAQIEKVIGCFASLVYSDFAALVMCVF